MLGKEQLERGDAGASLEGFLLWKNRNALLGLPTKLKHLHPEQSHAKHNKQKRLSPTLLGSLAPAHNGFHRTCFAITTNSIWPAAMAALFSKDKKINFLTHCSARALLPGATARESPGVSESCAVLGTEILRALCHPGAGGAALCQPFIPQAQLSSAGTDQPGSAQAGSAQPGSAQALPPRGTQSPVHSGQ